MAHKKVVLTDRLRHESELHIVKPDGTTAFVYFVSEPIKNEADKIIQCRTTITDITQTRSEQRYRSLFDQNLDAVFTVDRDSRFTDANPATQRIWGYGREELLKKTFVELCVPEQWDAVWRYFEQGFKGESDSLEVTITAKDGRQVEMLLTGRPIVAERQITGMFGIAKDVTERRRRRNS